MREWQNILPVEEKSIYNNAGYNRANELGQRVALIIIDCTYAFLGSHPDQSISEAMKEYPTACGPSGWEALPRIAKLLQVCRENSFPVVFTREDIITQSVTGIYATKGSSHRPPQSIERRQKGNDIPDMIKPLNTEWVLEKGRASAFHGTLLSTYLIMNSIDTLIVSGTTTSGCVTSTVEDAFASGFNVFVVEDCCFDRAKTPHNSNLWDMNAKYATVVTLDEISKMINKI